MCNIINFELLAILITAIGVVLLVIVIHMAWQRDNNHEILRNKMSREVHYNPPPPGFEPIKYAPTSAPPPKIYPNQPNG